MNKYVTEWNSLETFGSKGRAFKRYPDYLAPAGRATLKYASVIGTVLSIISLAMVMM